MDAADEVRAWPGRARPSQLIHVLGGHEWANLQHGAAGMMRYALVVLGGVLLSGVLSGIAGWVVARSTDMQGILSVAADRQAGQGVGEQRAEEFWKALERQSFRSKWIYCPGVAMVVGAFVGLFQRRHTWESALAAAAPFAILFSIGTQGVVSGLPLLGLYLGIAAVSAWGVAAAIARARTSEAP